VQDTYVNSVFYADFKYVICFAKKSRNLDEIGQISAERYISALYDSKKCLTHKISLV
jgi:hypothetical protein